VVGDLDAGRQCHVEISDDVDPEGLETTDLCSELRVGEEKRTAYGRRQLGSCGQCVDVRLGCNHNLVGT
jgi:hypothetical protein